MESTLGLVQGAARPQRRRPAVPSNVLGMLIFVVCEVMFFAGLISAFTIVRSGTLPVLWPPPGQPRLPASSTALNTALLLASGVGVFLAYLWRNRSSRTASHLLGAGWLLGAGFVGLQGAEWVALLRQGLTLTSSALGGFFYLIVGAHGLHAIVALGILGHAWLGLRKGGLRSDYFLTLLIFWAFVVLLWPFLYFRVYF